MRKLFCRLSVFLAGFILLFLLPACNKAPEETERPTVYEIVTGTKPDLSTEAPSSSETGNSRPSGSSDAPTDPVPETTVPEILPDTVLEHYQDLFLVTMTDVLNMRAEAKTTSDIVGVLYRNNGGEVLEVLPGWLRIRSGGIEGYIVADYVSTGEAARNQAPKAAKWMFRVSADNASIHAVPDDISARIASVPKGQVI